MRKSIVGWIIGLCLFIPFSEAQARGVGTLAANFLTVLQGARPAGMGGAFAALADDINCLEWNPAGLSNLTPDYFDASLEHVFWFGDVEQEVFSYAQNLGENYGGGGQVIYRHMPDIDNDLEDETPQKVYDVAGVVGTGFKTSNFSLGVNVKFVLSQLAGESLTGMAADLGLLIPMIEKKLSFGLTIKNLGPDIRGDAMPLAIYGGAAYTESLGENHEHVLNGILELQQPLSGNLWILAGVEYWYMKTFAARMGFRQQAGGDDLQTQNLMQHVSLGTSVRWADLQLDYAFVPYADLGSTHRLGVTIHYGPIHDKL